MSAPLLDAPHRGLSAPLPVSAHPTDHEGDEESQHTSAEIPQRSQPVDDSQDRLCFEQQEVEDERSVSAVGELPDLTGRLIQQGLFQEYTEYRARYQRWRSGGARGAAGELGSLEAPPQEASRPHHQIPTPQKFAFFFTISYWIAIFSVVGAMILTFHAYHALIHSFDMFPESAHISLMEDYPKLAAWLAFIGDVIFTVGAYLGYVELINIPESQHGLYIMADWKKIRECVPLESRVGPMAYLLGMLIWDVAAFMELLPWEFEGVTKILLISFPSFLGGISFAIGGVCEILHNRDKTIAFVEWWASFLDCIGGFCFFMVGCAGLLVGFEGAKRFSTICTAFAITLYLITGVLTVKMWRGNDFGLTFFSGLNEVLRAGKGFSIAPAAGQDALQVRTNLSFSNLFQSQIKRAEEKHKLSTRGIVFMVIYCWTLATTLMNCVANVFWTESRGRHFTDMAEGILWILIVTNVLIIHSAVTSVPNQQPYRLAYLLTRGSMIFAAIEGTVRLFGWGFGE